MDKINNFLMYMSQQPTHPGLVGLENAVFAAVAARRVKTQNSRKLAITAIISLGIGLASGQISPGQAQTTDQLMPFGAPASLTPSSLLDSGE